MDSALALQIVGRSAEMTQDEVLWVLRRKGTPFLMGDGGSLDPLEVMSLRLEGRAYLRNS